MKRFGEKAVREAIANGAIIRAWDYYTLDAGYRVIIDEATAGYIVSDLFFKLKNDGTIKKDYWGFSYTDYKAAAEDDEIAAFSDFVENLPDEVILLVSNDVIREIWANASSAERATANCIEYAATIRAEKAAAETEKTAEEWAAESERVQEATAAALEAVIATEEAPAEETTEETEPEYLDERWPESNEQPGIWYSLDYENGAPTFYNSVSDFRTGVHQANYNGRRIAAAWRHDDSTKTRRAIIPETSQEKTDRENREHCKRIAEDLEAYAAGNVYKCPECGREHTWERIEESEHEDEFGWAAYTCPDCGAEVSENDWEQMTLYDYFSDCLDIEYRCGSDREYRSVCIMVACGGPNIYIDTAEKAVLLYWWTDRARYYLSNDAVDAVDDWAREYWECL